MKRINGLVVTVFFLLVPPAFAGKNSQPFRIEVAKGISASLRAKMWRATKAKCLQMGYSIETEDQELGSILCSLPSPMGSYTILVTFEPDAFSVTSRGTATRVPLMGGIMNSAKRRRKEMLEYLAVVAGVEH